jgi:pilus assembly protein Flp/PilA
MKFINKLIRDNAGATAIEYGLIAALISLAGITAFTSFGTSQAGLFTEAGGGVDAVNGAAA